MSHTLTVETKFLDARAVENAAREMSCEIVRGEIALFDGTKIQGIGVKLPGWYYPVAINLQTGEAKYDNYNGKWGNQEHLNRFTQLYAVHKTELFAKSRGWIATRKTQPNGSIKLQLVGC